MELDQLLDIPNADAAEEVAEFLLREFSPGGSGISGGGGGGGVHPYGAQQQQPQVNNQFMHLQQQQQSQQPFFQVDNAHLEEDTKKFIPNIAGGATSPFSASDDNSQQSSYRQENTNGYADLYQHQEFSFQGGSFRDRSSESSDVHIRFEDI